MRRATLVKFAEECVMCIEMYVLIKKKMFTNGLNIGLLQQAQVKNTVHEMKTQKRQNSGCNSQ